MWRFVDSELVYHVKERGLVSMNYFTGNKTVILANRILVIFKSFSGLGPIYKIHFQSEYNIRSFRVSDDRAFVLLEYDSIQVSVRLSTVQYSISLEYDFIQVSVELREVSQAFHFTPSFPRWKL